MDFNPFVRRRESFLKHLRGAAAIIPAATTVTHHADCEYPFRQDSDFWYLTGFDEPDAIALFLSHRPQGEQYVLFILPSAPDLEVWNGPRAGIDLAIKTFGADLAHSLEELPKYLPLYLQGAKEIAFRVGKHKKIERHVLKEISTQVDKVARNGESPFPLVSPSLLLHQMRLRKDKHEIDSLRKAAQISAEAHELVREFARPNMNERQLQGFIENHFLQNGARGPAYGSIIAGGDNACILHYISNNRIINNGDLVLIDAGCSMMDYYNADITRTFPINGSFTGEQKAIYEVVLAAQEAAIGCVLPGNNTEDIHMKAVKVLVQGLLEIGLLKGSLDSIIEQKGYSHLYMHRTGHWLGLDVHDVGAYRLGEYPLSLEEGMVLTVEPGIYISDRLPVPEGQPSIEDRWKGIGIRIEDDILVQPGSHEIITAKAKKSLEEMEF